MVFDYAIRFDTYEDFEKDYGYVEDLQDRWGLMICSKELAEQILDCKITDTFESNVRCTKCGSNKINKVFSYHLKGFIKDNGIHEYPDFIPESDKFSEAVVDRFECACCGNNIKL